jgi:DNA helicase-2/ATP-dependent DNA helicase PcrA
MSDYLNEQRIFGPPGTGKTTTTKRLVQHACQQYGSEAILVASFTRTAAMVLVGRDLPIDEQRIGTLHAHCYRALGRPKLVNAALLKDWNAEHPTRQFGGISNDMDDPYGAFDTSGKQDGDVLLEDMSRLRGLMLPEEVWPVRVQSFARQWKDFKDQTFTMDFTDLIEQGMGEAIPFGAEVFFCDEVQDFSPLELALVRKWGASCEQLYMAGDDDQTLYSFKGATPDAFLNPPLPEERVTVLGQSYRVPRAVHAAAMRWVEQIEYRQTKLYQPRPVEGEVGTLSSNYQYVDPLRRRIEEWTEAGKTVAFLASCSFFLEPLKRALRDWGVPFHNPYRLTRGDWNPLGSFSHRDRAKDACLASHRLLAYTKPARTQQWWTYGDLWEWIGVLEADGLFARGAKTEIRRKAEDENTTSLLVETEDLERWITDPEAGDKATAGDLDWYRSKILRSAQKPMSYACNILEKRGIEALTKRPQVLLGTIHSVKGGEADIVVLFPDLSPAGFRAWHSKEKDSVRRCFYVGMTRAKEALYWAQPVGMSIGGYL